LEPDACKATWDSGIGAAKTCAGVKSGGRWNFKGVHAVYCALDPATATMEVAVYVGFNDLDSVPRVLTSFALLSPASIHVVNPADVSNPNWLRPGHPSANQRKFGDALLAKHGVVVIPSAVSSHSWNISFWPELPLQITAFGHRNALPLIRGWHPERQCDLIA